MKENSRTPEKWREVMQVIFERLPFSKDHLASAESTYGTLPMFFNFYIDSSPVFFHFILKHLL